MACPRKTENPAVIRTDFDNQGPWGQICGLILLALWTLLPTFAPAQDQSFTKEVQPPKKFVFSGAITESDCRDLPTSSFEVRPSGPRWKTTDRLVIDCLPTPNQRNSFILTLTFVITEPLPSQPDVGDRHYTFRWGESKDPKRPHHPPVGEFARDYDRCARLAAFFTAKGSKNITFTTEHLHESPHWSVSCNGDDLWGVSMEFEFLGRFPESL